MARTSRYSLVDDAKGNPSDARYLCRHRVDSEAGKIPDRIDLALTSARP